jgi:glycosyltransferase involved in cell wall biosynthesis
MRIIALIPAYNPTDQLVDYVNRLSKANFESVIVVNDGSNEQCNHIFTELNRIDNVMVLRHAINMGKGAALKTGFNYALCYFREYDGVVTIDSDGQHLIEDAINVAAALQGEPDTLIMGVRRFSAEVPIKSRIGNNVTNRLFAYLIGKKLTDTQTGLRGIPMDFLPSILKIGANGYEFELDMLLACKHSGRKIREVQISTVYIDNNVGTHFNPIVDSIKIYYVLFRYAITSLITAMIDLIVFIVTIKMIGSIGLSQILGRLIGLIFNYAAVSRLVFYSEQKHTTTFPKYLSLVCGSGIISYFLINEISANFGIKIITAKIVAESVIFLANFAIQRDFIFTKPVTVKHTDS